MENTGTHFETETEKLASAINNLANAVNRLNEQSVVKENLTTEKDGEDTPEEIKEKLVKGVKELEEEKNRVTWGEDTIEEQKEKLWELIDSYKNSGSIDKERENGNY